MRLFFLGPRFFGLRAGISLGREDFRPRRTAAGQVKGSFVYVIGGPPGMVKIGVTTDPRSRFATLQTGCPYPLKLIALLATPGEGYDIEVRAHTMVWPQRMTGEWFRISPAAALVAVKTAADELGEPLLSVSLERAEEILALGRTASTGSGARPSVPWGFLAWLGSGVVAFALVFAWLSRLMPPGQ